MKTIKNLISQDNKKFKEETVSGVAIVAIAVYLVYTFSWIV